MNEDFDSIRILEKMMLELHGLALEREVTVSDIVHEALDEYLYAHTNSINLFDVIHSIENAMNPADRFVTSADPASLVIFIKSPIRYVYRPELKYEVRIMRNDRVSVGKLSVALRTHDMETIKRFSDFIALWIALERKYITRSRAERIAYMTDDGYFCRQIFYPEASAHSDARTIGDAISSYIHVFDELLKYCINQRNAQMIEQIYLDRLRTGKLTI